MRFSFIASLFALALAACSAESSTGTGSGTSTGTGTGTGTSTGTTNDPCRGVVCAALDQCHDIGRCDPATGRCTDPAKADATPCDDGNESTRGDVCTSGVCAGIDRCATVRCAAPDACHEPGNCDPETGTCPHPAKPDGTACDDGNARTIQDACVSGTCRGKDLCANVTCTAKDVCHDAGTCDPETGTCSEPAKADGTACDDGNAATNGDSCKAGVCAGSTSDGETCARAIVITAPYQANITPGTTSDYATSTGCSTGSGKDRVFAIDVPAGKRLYASVRGLATFDPGLSLVGDLSACTTAPTCLASDDSGSATSLNAVTQVNTGASTRRYFLIVDSILSSGTGDVELRAVVGDALPGDTCGTATAVPFTNGLASLSAETVDLYANDYKSGTSCTGFAGGERVYRFEIPSGNTATFTATPSATFDLSINVVEAATTGAPESACGTGMTCAAGANTGTAGVAERAVYRNTGGATKVVFVTVEAATSATTPGTFSLAAELSTGLPGDTCTNPPQVTFSGDTATLAGESLATAANDYGSGTNCLGTSGPERGYRVTIPAGRILTVTATATGAGTTFDPSLNIVSEADCAASARVCLASAGTTGTTETVRYANGSTSPANVVVFVETAATTVPTPGTFDLRFTLSDPAPGETCSSATTVTAGTINAQSLLNFENDYRSGTGCSGAGGPDRVYKIVVPAGDELTATVTPSGAWDPAINLQLAAGCGLTRACLSGSDAGGSSAPDTATWRNGTGASAEVFVVVETYSSIAPAAGNLREFSLDLQISTPPPAPAGDLCTNATSIGAGTLSGQTLIGYRNDYAGDSTSGCEGTAGPDRLYVVNVAAGQRLTATVNPVAASGGSTWDPSINLHTLAACGATRTCLAGNDAGASGASDAVEWINNSSAAVDVYIAVETYSTAAPASGAARDFDLVVVLDRPAASPADDVCSDATTPIATTTTLSTETLGSYRHDYGPALTGLCETVSAASGGLDRAYRVTIPAGKTITARITPDANWDPTISLVLGAAAACGSSMTCVAGADVGYKGTAEEITYTNTGASAVDGFLVVDSWRSSLTTTYPYALAITLSP